LTEKPLVSVVIPTHDRCRRLLLALRSVLCQRDVNLEVVVVDDGSRDDTHKMVTHLGEPRVRLVRNESPQGESAARNRGLAEARGVWIAFLDDDDLWAPHKLGRQLQAVLETRREWAYAGDVAVDGQLRILYGAPPPPPEEVMKSLRRHNSVPGGASNVIASSELLARVGPFDPGLKRTADWDMWLRLARAGPPAWVRHPLVAICIHPGNMSRDMSVMFRELDVLARRYGIPVDRARHYRWAAWVAQLEGQRREALRYYSGAVAAGDLRSVGRAAVALVRPIYARTGTRKGDAWTNEARSWLDELAQWADEVPFPSGSPVRR
jgi:glycosyltransferase involved in cell wall biosynthesis